MNPDDLPVGRLLGLAAKATGEAFEKALATEGGSPAAWLILMSLMRHGDLAHAELADRVGVRGPTLTHHLDVMEARGLVERRRHAENRRVQFTSLTPDGTALFHRLRRTAQAHDARLTQGLSAEDLAALRRILGRMIENIDI